MATWFALRVASRHRAFMQASQISRSASAWTRPFSSVSQGDEYLIPSANPTSIRKPIRGGQKKRESLARRRNANNNKLKLGRVDSELKEALKKFPHEPAAVLAKNDPTTMVLLEKKYSEDFAKDAVDYDALVDDLLEDPGHNITEQVTALRKTAIVDPKLFFKSHEPTISNFNQLLMNQAFRGELTLLKETFELMKAESVPADLVSYTAHFTCFAHSPVGIRPITDLIKAIDDEGLVPDAPLTGAIVQAFCKQGAMAKAKSLLLRYKEAYGLETNEVMYTSLVAGYVQAKMYPEAWSTYKTFMSEHGPGDVVMVTTLMKACAEVRDAPRALSLFEDILAAGQEPTEVTFNVLARACARRPDYFEKSLEIFDRMRGYGYKMDEYSFNTMLYSCAQLGQVVFAEGVFAKLRESYSPSLLSCNTLLSGYKNAQLWGDHSLQQAHIDRARAIVEDLLPSLELSPDIWTLNAYLGVLANGNRVNRALEFFSSTMPSQYDTAPDIHSYRLILQMYLRVHKYERAVELLAEGSKEGIVWEEVDFLRLLRGVRKRTKDLPLALDLLESLPRLYPEFTLTTRSLGALEKRVRRHAPHLLPRWQQLHHRATQSEREFKAHTTVKPIPRSKKG